MLKPLGRSIVIWAFTHPFQKPRVLHWNSRSLAKAAARMPSALETASLTPLTVCAFDSTCVPRVTLLDF